MRQIPITLLVKIFLSCCFFWILFSFIQTNKLVEIFSQINWYFFTLSLIITPCMVMVSCYKWKMVLDLRKKISFFRLIKIYLIGHFFSNLLPSTMGGDVVRSFYSGNIIKNHYFSVISIFIERFSGFIVLLLLVFIMPLFKIELYAQPHFFIPASISIVALLIIFFLMSRKRSSLKFLDISYQLVTRYLNRVISFVTRTDTHPLEAKVDKFFYSIVTKIKKLISELSDALQTIKTEKNLTSRIFTCTLVFYFFTFLNVYLSFRAFNVTPNFFQICIIVPTILLVAQFPVTLLGNIGFFESVFVFYFFALGIPAVETLAMGLLLRIKLLAVGIIGYLIYLSYDVKYTGFKVGQKTVNNKQPGE